MAQLKVKQISDFVTAVGTIHNATVGTANATAIANAKSEALVSAYSADVVAKSEAIASAVSQAEAKDVSRASTAVVNISTAKSEAIASAVSQAEAKDVSRASTAVVNISTAKSEAISAAVLADVTVLSSAKAYSDIQKGRIDTLLSGSTAALDTFKEIEGFITSLDTADVAGLSTALSTAVSNDAVHASGISANSTAIANLDFGVDLSLETSATTNTIVNSNGTDVTLEGATEEVAGLMTADDFRKLGRIEDLADVTDSVNVRAAGALMDDEITNLSQVKAFASSDYATASQGDLADSAVQNLSDLSISASATELNQLDGVTLGNIVTYNYSSVTTDISNAITTEVTNRNTAITTAINALDLDLQGQIDNLAGVNSDEVVATFVGTTSFRVDAAFDLNGHVAVFVNGLQVHELFGEGGEAEGWRSDDGLIFTVQRLGYLLEDNDHIIVSGTLV
jgi:hypothetical protein